MASRGSALDRAIRYFEEASLREVRVAFQIVKETVETRLDAANINERAVTLKKLMRKPKAKAAADPVTESKEHESLASA
jgi:hypothetical protein